MAVIAAPDMGSEAGWMRSAWLVLALAEAGEPGAEGRVPGASLLPGGRPGFPVLLFER